MGLPSKKTPKSKTKSRRSHHALRKVRLQECPKCKKSILPHRACLFCGTYRGKEVAVIKRRLEVRRLKLKKRVDKKKKEEEEGAEEKKKPSSFKLQK